MNSCFGKSSVGGGLIAACLFALICELALVWVKEGETGQTKFLSLSLSLK